MANAQGREAITGDGCPVEVYRRLSDGGEAEFISDAIRPGASVLDLGAGAGRIADALVALGHAVVAVDNSAEMLAAVQRAEPALADIETYRDPRRFDAVLLASHLINAPNANTRRALLTTVAHHLDVDGTAFIEWHRPEWFKALIPGEVYCGTIGEVSSTLNVVSLDDGRLSGTVTYTIGGDEWSQSFTTQRLTVADLLDELGRVGLSFVHAEPLRGGWVLAHRT